MRTNCPSWLVRGVTALAVGVVGCSTDDAGTATTDVTASSDAGPKEDESSFADDLLEATKDKSSATDAGADPEPSTAP